MLRGVLAVATAIALTMSSCGGDGSPAAEQAETAKAGGTTPADSPSQSFPEGTIPAVLEAQGRFDTFMEIIRDRGEFFPSELSRQDRKFTVFAPTDDVFEALPPGTLDSLLAEENGRVLFDFLLRHVLPTEVSRKDFASRGNLHTLAPALEPNQVTVDEGTVRVSGGSGMSTVTVIEFGIEASNGTIHVVDGLIVPEDLGQGPAA